MYSLGLVMFCPFWLVSIPCCNSLRIFRSNCIDFNQSTWDAGLFLQILLMIVDGCALLWAVSISLLIFLRNGFTVHGVALPLTVLLFEVLLKRIPFPFVFCFSFLCPIVVWFTRCKLFVWGLWLFSAMGLFPFYCGHWYYFAWWIFFPGMMNVNY